MSSHESNQSFSFADDLAFSLPDDHEDCHDDGNAGRTEAVSDAPDSSAKGCLPFISPAQRELESALGAAEEGPGVNPSLEQILRYAGLVRRNGQGDGSCAEGKGSPLEHAVRGGHSEIIKMLLEAGAVFPKEMRDGKGLKTTPLKEAILHGNGGTVKVLLDAGADPHAFPVPSISATTTPLNEAIVHANITAVELLLEAGADPNLSQLLNGFARQ